MAEFRNLFTEYSELRASERAELELLGVDELQIRQAVSEIHPFMERSAVEMAEDHAREEEAPVADDKDYNFDRDDVLSDNWRASHQEYKGE